jgi:colanic acid biosynthesis glycosyl transferase WcaI
MERSFLIHKKADYMRILIYGINFTPELVGNGKYTGEMVEWLARHGHEVRVVTAPPFNPSYKIGEGYSAWRYRRQRFTTADGAGSFTAFRCPLYVPPNLSAVRRILHLASFAVSSLPVMVLQAFWRPSLVIVIEPTAFCMPGGAITAWLSGARSWLHIQDFEVDAGFALGLLKSTTLRNLIVALDRKLMLKFDRVSTISGKMMERLGDKGFPPERSVMFPNWVDTKAIFPAGKASPLREELGIRDDAVVALYSGTMGRKQGLEIMAKAADFLSKSKSIQFVFCGEGPYRATLEGLSARLPNVHWLPLQPFDRLNDLMNLADIHLLPQCAEAADLVMPSKLTGMFASGRPVVATADNGTQLAAAVRECGVVVPPDDATRFSEAIVQLAENAELRTRLGRNARQCAEMTLDKEKILMAIDEEFSRVVGSSYRPNISRAAETQPLRDVS